jgi:hypothetical protein
MPGACDETASETLRRSRAWLVILFLTIGLILLSRESEWAAGKLDWLKNRYPRFGKTYDEADRRAMRLWERLRGRKRPD